ETGRHALAGLAGRCPTTVSYFLPTANERRASCVPTPERFCSAPARGRIARHVICTAESAAPYVSYLRKSRPQKEQKHASSNRGTFGPARRSTGPERLGPGAQRRPSRDCPPQAGGLRHHADQGER